MTFNAGLSALNYDEAANSQDRDQLFSDQDMLSGGVIAHSQIL